MRHFPKNRVLVKPGFIGIWRSVAATHPLPLERLLDDPDGLREPTLETASLRIAAGGHAAADGIAAIVDGWLLDNQQNTLTGAEAAASLLGRYRSANRPGPAWLNSLSGQFALIIIDESAQRVLLATDRMGTHPLAYAEPAAGQLSFGSSALTVARTLPSGPKVRPQALFDYMHFHMVPSPDTVFEGVAKLPPGHYVEMSNGRLHSGRYWLPDFSRASSPDIDELQQQLHTALHDAVLSCRPDRQTGAFLSGGLDSSSLVGKLAEVQDGAADTFSMGFDADGFDEMEYARATAARFGVNPHEMYVTPDDITNAIPVVASAYDEPFGNSSAIPTYACARFAKESGMRALIAGDGGDELFGGNPHYTRQKLFEYYWRLPQGLRQRAIEPVALNLLKEDAVWPLGKLRSYVQQARIPLPERLHSWNFMFREPSDTIFSAGFLADIDPAHPVATMNRAYTEAGDASVLDKLLFFDWQFVLADTDLRKVSRMCEVAGIDVHYPMLDPRVIDLSLQIPDRLKIRGQNLRYFFKQAMTGYLPQSVIDKPKHGFGLPFGVWLKSDPGLRELIYGSLAALEKRNIFNPQFLREIVALQQAGHASYYGYVIWDLALLECWMQAHKLSI